MKQAPLEIEQALFLQYGSHRSLFFVFISFSGLAVSFGCLWIVYGASPADNAQALLLQYCTLRSRVFIHVFFGAECFCWALRY